MINQQRLVKTFMELVQIDSPTGEEQTFKEYCAEQLKQLGGAIAYDTFGNLFAKFEGEGEPLMLNCHLDTVEPGKGIKPNVKGDTIVTDGTTILGGDPKAGIAVILETLTSLNEDKKSHPPLDVVLTLKEEIGLVGSLNLDYRMLRAKQGITFDGEESVTNVIIGSPGYNHIVLDITGRSAHAGVEPEKGISSIQIAADIITNLKLGRIDEQTTANIGKISGGSAVNAVPESTHVEGEIRSRDLTKLENHSNHVKKVVATVQKNYPEATIALTIKREFDPYTFTPDHPMIGKIKAVLAQLNLVPKLYASGGGTDVNMFQKNGIQAICVGAGSFLLHTKREYVNIQELTNTAKFCELLVETWN